MERGDGMITPLPVVNGNNQNNKNIIGRDGDFTSGSARAAFFMLSDDEFFNAVIDMQHINAC